jgi:hypothetical protein
MNTTGVRHVQPPLIKILKVDHISRVIIANDAGLYIRSETHDDAGCVGDHYGIVIVEVAWKLNLGGKPSRCTIHRYGDALGPSLRSRHVNGGISLQWAQVYSLKDNSFIAMFLILQLPSWKGKSST